jgi:uncharacterized membrane protein
VVDGHELAVNYAHDVTWAVVTEGTGLTEADTRTTRTMTYTALNVVRVFGLGMLITGDPTASLGYVAFNAAADAVVYAMNDAAWSSVWPTGQSASLRPALQE